MFVDVLYPVQQQSAAVSHFDFLSSQISNKTLTECSYPLRLRSTSQATPECFVCKHRANIAKKHTFLSVASFTLGKIIWTWAFWMKSTAKVEVWFPFRTLVRICVQCYQCSHSTKHKAVYLMTKYGIMLPQSIVEFAFATDVSDFIIR